MTTTVQSIVTKLRFLTLDIAGVRWTDDELISWVNDAQVEIVNYKPTASIANIPIPLVAGVRQEIPAGALVLLDITHNSASGIVCTQIKRVDLDRSSPAWPAAVADVDAEHYMVDDEDPKTFLVYPPNDATGILRGRVSTLPAIVEALIDPIALTDEYAPIMLNYMLYRVWAKHSTSPNAAALSAAAFENFLRALGVKIQSQITYSPRRNQEDDTNDTSPV